MKKLLIILGLITVLISCKAQHRTADTVYWYTSKDTMLMIIALGEVTFVSTNDTILFQKKVLIEDTLNIGGTEILQTGQSLKIDNSGAEFLMDNSSDTGIFYVEILKFLPVNHSPIGNKGAFFYHNDEDRFWGRLSSAWDGVVMRSDSGSVFSTPTDGGGAGVMDTAGGQNTSMIAYFTDKNTLDGSGALEYDGTWIKIDRNDGIDFTGQGGGNNWQLYQQDANDFFLDHNGGREFRFIAGAPGYITGTANSAGFVAVKNSVGTSTDPNYAFADDLNTGIGWAGADQLSLIAGGNEIVEILTSNITMYKNTRFLDSVIIDSVAWLMKEVYFPKITNYTDTDTVPLLRLPGGEIVSSNSSWTTSSDWFWTWDKKGNLISYYFKCKKRESLMLPYKGTKGGIVESWELDSPHEIHQVVAELERNIIYDIRQHIWLLILTLIVVVQSVLIVYLIRRK